MHFLKNPRFAELAKKKYFPIYGNLGCTLVFEYMLKQLNQVEKFASYYLIFGGHAVAQLVEALRYKSEGRGFDSRWCHWNFSMT